MTIAAPNGIGRADGLDGADGLEQADVADDVDAAVGPAGTDETTSGGPRPGNEREAGTADADSRVPGAGPSAGDGVGERAGTSERAREGVEHLQAAARELIQAARALLDVAEDLVEDPETVTQFVGAVGTLGSLVRDATGIGGRASAPTARRHGPGPGDDPGGESADRRPGRPAGTGRSDSGLQRIPVL